MLPWQRKSVAPAVPAFLSGQLLVFGYQGWVVLLASLLLLHAVCYILAVKCRGTMLDPLSRDPMLAAHFLPQLLAFVLSAYCGAGDWMFHMSSESGEDIGAYLPQGERIACIMIGFQLYELMSCYFSKVSRRMFACDPAHPAACASPPPRTLSSLPTLLAYVAVARGRQ